MKDIKLIPKQKEVVRLMSKGWELGLSKRNLNASTPLPDRYRLQQGGLGNGGQVKYYRRPTIGVLFKLGLISQELYNNPILSSAGKQLAETLK